MESPKKLSFPKKQGNYILSLILKVRLIMKTEVPLLIWLHPYILNLLALSQSQ